ncbi:uncharacterized protein F5891DRAFT_973815 [Suillus fuscotomentosus]|uniref:Uncharacterized protein n=1 Tax=Suillus fuscotomentosus TaxID=1912939 RepID=A0AAD4ELH6_9AGAM|nr:uncharacterized protein F5891DRAFT_973815 [Suillus fuscotomentosus]KAG1908395.1 hypothetical protein F5891DRAFT_973815 [Suillus fuscotomentosus]
MSESPTSSLITIASSFNTLSSSSEWTTAHQLSAGWALGTGAYIPTIGVWVWVWVPKVHTPTHTHEIPTPTTHLPLADNYYDSQYPSFLQFSLDPDILEKTGDEVVTLGEQLESVFGWKARTSGDGVIPILERGKAICALHGILMLYYEKYPTNNVLKKWIHDITAGAEKVYKMYGVPTPECSKEPVRQQGTKRPAPAVTIMHSQSTGSKGNAQLEQALKHVTTCKILQADHVELWRQVIQESGDNSLGARLQKDLAAEDIPMEVEPPMKRLRAQNTLNMADL